MSRHVVFCGYGWLARYLAERLQNDSAAQWSLTATTTTPNKAEALNNKSIDAHLFKLGDATTALLPLFNQSVLLLNIPPGRRKTDLSDFTTQMKALIDDALTANVQHIVFISTTSVYGDNHNHSITETSATAPETASAIAHVAIEDHLLSKAQDRTTIVRLSGLIGPDRHPVNSLSGRHLKQGNKRVNLVDARDATEALLSILNRSPSKEVFHLSAPSHPKRGTYYTAMAVERDLPLPTFDDTNLPPCGKEINAEYSWERLGVVPKYDAQV